MFQTSGKRISRAFQPCIALCPFDKKIWSICPEHFPPRNLEKRGEFYLCHIFVHVLRPTVGSFSVNSKIYFLDLWKGNFKSFLTVGSVCPPRFGKWDYQSQTFSHQNKERRKKNAQILLFYSFVYTFKKSQVGSTVIPSFIFQTSGKRISRAFQPCIALCPPKFLSQSFCP